MSRKRSFEEINVKDFNDSMNTDGLNSTTGSQLIQKEDKSMKTLSSVQSRLNVNSFSSLSTTSLEEYYANIKKYNIANLELPERDRWEKMNKSLYGIYFSLGNSASEFQYLNRDDTNSSTNDNTFQPNVIHLNSSSSHHLSQSFSSSADTGTYSWSNRGSATQRITNSTNSISNGNGENNMNRPNLMNAGVTTPVCTFSKDQKEIYGDRVYRMARASHGVHAGNWYYEVEILEGPTGLEYDKERKAIKELKVMAEASKIQKKRMENQNVNIVFRLGWASKKADVEAPVGFDQHSYALRSKYGSRITKSQREDDWTVVNSKNDNKEGEQEKGSSILQQTINNITTQNTKASNNIMNNNGAAKNDENGNEIELDNDAKLVINGRDPVGDQYHNAKGENNTIEDKEKEDLDIKFQIPLIESSFGAGDVLGCAIFLSEIPLHLAPQGRQRNGKGRGQNDAIVEGGLASQLGILIPSSNESSNSSDAEGKKQHKNKSSSNIIQKNENCQPNSEREVKNNSKNEFNNGISSTDNNTTNNDMVSYNTNVSCGNDVNLYSEQNEDPDLQALQILDNIEKEIERENSGLTSINDSKTNTDKMSKPKLKHNDNYYFGNHIRFYKNGKDLGIAFCHLPPGYYTPAISIYGGGGGVRANFGPKWIAAPEHIKNNKDKHGIGGNSSLHKTSDGLLSKAMSSKKMKNKNKHISGNAKSHFLGGGKKTITMGNGIGFNNETITSGTPFSSMGLTLHEKIQKRVEESLHNKIMELKEHENSTVDEETTKSLRPTEDKTKVNVNVNNPVSIQGQDKYLKNFEIKERKRIEEEEKRNVLKTIRRTTVDDSVREKLKPIQRTNSTLQKNSDYQNSTSLYTNQDRYILSGSEYSLSIPYQPINDLSCDWCQDKKSEPWKSYNDYVKRKSKELRSRLKEREKTSS